MSLLARILLHVAAAGVGTYLAFAVTFDSRFSRVQTDPGDTALNHYLLEHTWRWAADPAYPHGLWSPPFYHPQRTVLAYSENLFGVAPLYWLLRLGLPSVLAFQVWMMLLSLLNYASMAVVLRRLPVRPGERLPAVLVAVGSFLWAFGLPQQLLIAHPQLIGRFWMPPAAYLAWRFALAPSVRLLGLMLLMDFLQVLACINSGWLLTLGLGVYLPASVWANGTGPQVRAFVREQWRPIAAVAGGWAAALGGLMTPYVVANFGLQRTYGECIQFLPTFSSAFAGPPGSPWYGALLHIRDWVGGETMFFSGLGLYALAAAAAWVVATRRHDVKVQSARRFAVAGLVTAAGLFLLTVDYGDGVSFWWFLRLLPGGMAIRAVGRVEMVVHLFLIPAALVGFAAWLHGRVPAGPVQTGLLLVLAGFVAFEQTGHDSLSYEAAAVHGRAERVGRLAAGADVFYLVPPPDEDPLYAGVIAIWAGLDAGVPTVNGYSGRRPTGYPEAWQLTDDEVTAWLGPSFRGRLRIIDPNTEPWAVRDHVLGASRTP